MNFNGESLRFQISKTILNFGISFKMNYNGAKDISLYQRYYSLYPIIVACYLFSILVLQGLKLNKPKSKIPLVLWNLQLSLFSLFGFYNLFGYIIPKVLEIGIIKAVCVLPNEEVSNGQVGFYSMLFLVSKFFEFIDTYLIIIYQKPLTFLHVYHHVTVLLLTWNGYAFRSPQSLFFAANNYFVHFFMYLYYGLTSTGMINRRITSYIAPFITFIQIVQMFIGVFICSVVLVSKILKIECQVKNDNLFFSMLVYFTYLCMFTDFARRKYLN